MIQLSMYTQCRFFSRIEHPRILGRVPCARRQVPVGRSFLIPRWAYTSPEPPGHPSRPHLFPLVEQFQVHRKMESKCTEFPSSCQPSCTAFPIRSIPGQRGTFDTIREPTLRHHYHLKTVDRLPFTLGVVHAMGLATVSQHVSTIVISGCNTVSHCHCLKNPLCSTCWPSCFPSPRQPLLL